MDSYIIVNGPDITTLEGAVQPGTPLFVQRQSDHASIPFAGDNTDTQEFLYDWENGASVVDAASNPVPFDPAPLGLQNAIRRKRFG